jgi:short-subunit dehydrogenase
VALVTGASDGIGRAFATSLAARGLDLVLVARRAAVLDELASDLTLQYGIKARVVPLDLAEPEAATRLLAEVEADDVGLLVGAAGYGSSGSFLAQDAAEEARMVDLNCRAVVELAHGLGTRLSRRKRGGLVLFGSLVGFQGVPWSATYAATKAFVQSLAEGLAVELASHGVAVLSVAPGPVASGFGARARMSMGQAARPEAVAEAALRALGSSRLTVRPGFLSKGLGWSLGLLPRGARVRVMGQIMRGMAEGGR